jgi:hypothetical protein
LSSSEVVQHLVEPLLGSGDVVRAWDGPCDVRCNELLGCGA